MMTVENNAVSFLFIQGGLSIYRMIKT